MFYLRNLFSRFEKQVTRSPAYREGFHAYLYPADARAPADVTDDDYWLGWYDAKAACERFKRKFHMSPRLLVGGTIDMIIFDPSGNTVARVEPPMKSVEEAISIARAWMRKQEELLRKQEEDRES